MLNNEQIKQIKRINRRLAQMEESEYKDTSLYNDLLIRIEQSGLQIREDKNGNTRLSQSAKQEINNNINVDSTLKWIERVKTLKQAQKDYRKDFKGDKNKFYEDFKKYLNLKDRIKAYIEDYDSMQISTTSRKLHQFATNGKIRHMSYEELEEMLNQIEEEKNQYYNQMEDEQEPEFLPFSEDLFE